MLPQRVLIVLAGSLRRDDQNPCRLGAQHSNTRPQCDEEHVQKDGGAWNPAIPGEIVGFYEKYRTGRTATSVWCVRKCVWCVLLRRE